MKVSLERLRSWTPDQEGAREDRLKIERTGRMVPEPRKFARDERNRFTSSLGKPLEPACIESQLNEKRKKIKGKSRRE